MKTYLVLTEWLCCCKAPRPSCWRINSHVSTREYCPSWSTKVTGNHLHCACLWRTVIASRWLKRLSRYSQKQIYGLKDHIAFFKMLWTLFIAVFLTDLLSYFCSSLFHRGFCFFNSIAITAKYLRDKLNIGKILIVDLVCILGKHHTRCASRWKIMNLYL